MLRIVLDSNIYVGALIKRTSLPAQIIQAAQNEQILLISSPQIREEVVRVLHYPKIQKKYRITDIEIHELIQWLTEDTITTGNEVLVDIVKEDPSDNMFLACAVEANADYIVSGDHHLLKLDEYQGIKILTPRSFIEELQKETLRK